MSRTTIDGETSGEQPPAGDDHASFGRPRGLLTLSGPEVRERLPLLGARAVLVPSFAAAAGNGGTGPDAGTAASVPAARGALVHLCGRGRQRGFPAAAVGMASGPIRYVAGRRHLAGRSHAAEFAVAAGRAGAPAAPHHAPRPLRQP
ncbi:hypothetical protein ACIGBL_09320 [Streptomyces sp. NPDC085614]|uniref:hypothetical protein n=1 Tax=Streptomyces sp. NPDC085614 TaxID=3365733 RepID=UPI0037D74F8C